MQLQLAAARGIDDRVDIPTDQVFFSVAKHANRRIVDSCNDAVRVRDQNGLVHSGENSVDVVSRNGRSLELLAELVELLHQCTHVVVLADIERLAKIGLT